MEERRLKDSFDPLTMLMSLNSDGSTWREQVSAGIIYLISAVDELREENAILRNQIGAQPRLSQSDEDEKLVFNAIHVKPHLIKGFDPLQPNRSMTLGSIVSDFANGHGLNGCTNLTQVVQPITTGVVRKLFTINPEDYTFTEDSIGKGRPPRYVKVPTEFIKELSEAICDGFNPNRTQRAQILPQARTMAGAVARNYFNNVRSHHKKGKPNGESPARPDSNDTNSAHGSTPEPQLFDGRGFQPVSAYLPFPQPTTLPLVDFGAKLSLDSIGSQMETLQNLQSSTTSEKVDDSKMEET